MLRLTRLHDGDLARLEAALDAAGLPYDDVREAGRLFYWSEGPHPSFVGLEAFGRDALLRSLVVPPSARGKGLGREMVEALRDEARESGIERLWLLTTTAADFFAKIGFELVARQEAPPSIQATREFRDLCPASATFMKLDITRNPSVSVTIYHNPACGTSRNTLALIRATGVEPKVIHYLETPPSRAELVSLVQGMGISPRDLLREKGTPYAALSLGNLSLTDDQIIEAMVEHPVLINRPVVVGPKGVKLCRPSEEVLAVLDRPLEADFVKEDGDVVPANG